MSETSSTPSDAGKDLGTVVIGGGLAAAHCVHELREGGYAKPVTLIASENQIPYERPPPRTWNPFQPAGTQRPMSIYAWVSLPNPSTPRPRP